MSRTNTDDPPVNMGSLYAGGYVAGIKAAQESCLKIVKDCKAIYETKLAQAKEREFVGDYSRADLFKHAVEVCEYLERGIGDVT